MHTQTTFIILVALLCCRVTLAQSYVWQWARQSGSMGHDLVNGMGRGDDGHLFMAGSFEDTLQAGTQSREAIGSHDLYVASYDSTGRLDWLLTGGGKSYDYVSALCVADQSILVAGGLTDSVTIGPFNITGQGHRLFLARIHKNGSVIWLKTMAASFGDYIDDLVVTATGDLLLTGSFTGLLQWDSVALQARGRQDLMVVKLNKKGEVLWARSAGGYGVDRGTDLAVQGDRIVVAGSFEQTLDIDGRSAQVTTPHKQAVVFWELDEEGQTKHLIKVAEARQVGKPVVSFDADGRLYFSCEYKFEGLLGSLPLDNRGGEDLLLGAYDRFYNLLWYHTGGGILQDRVADMIVTEDGPVVTGSFMHTLTIGGDSLMATGMNSNIFIAAFSDHGDLQWLRQAGGDRSDYPRKLLADEHNNIMITGNFTRQMPVREQQLHARGQADLVLLKLHNCRQNKVKIVGDSLVCRGAKATLRVPPVYGRYDWNGQRNGQSHMQVDSGGLYRVQVTDTIGCVLADSVRVIQAEAPALDLGQDTTIAEDQNLLLALDSGYATVEWSDHVKANNRLVKGTDIGEGEHTVWVNVKDKNQCARQDTVRITVTKKDLKEDAGKLSDAEKLPYATIRVFPNPASDYINWTVTDADFKHLQIQLVNELSGEVRYRSTVKNYKQNTLHEISISQLPPGAYQLKVVTDAAERRVKVVKK